MKILNEAINSISESASSERDFFTGGTSIPLRESSRKEFLQLIKSANFIAIDSDYLMGITERILENNHLTGELIISDPSVSDLPISPPFKLQWVELSYRSGGSWAPSINYEGSILTILGMMINETSPDVYDVYTFENAKNSAGTFNTFSLTRNVLGTKPGDTNLQMVFASWMKAINNGALGIEEGEDVVMLPKENAKKPGKNKPHQIRRIVRIVPKNLKSKTDPIMTKGKIDFSHRWEVRGHWRKVNGIGKDRDGNYGINGLTWVNNFTKGPEDLPLVTKVRWVNGG